MYSIAEKKVRWSSNSVRSYTFVVVPTTSFVLEIVIFLIKWLAFSAL